MSEQENPQHAPVKGPAAPAPKPAVAPAPVKKVKVVNRLSQSLNVTVDRGNGPEVVTLAGHAASESIPADHLTEFTRGLVDKGHLVVRSVEE